MKNTLKIKLASFICPINHIFVIKPALYTRLLILKKLKYTFKKQPFTQYFKNLDGLRFWAAFAVIIGHCQQTIFDYEGYRPFEPYANKLASFGVDFFFVLSGFLISDLLIKEIEKTGSINVWNFYNRRMLRIFPLYFLVGLIGICTAQFWLKWFDYLTLFNGQYLKYTYNLKDFLVNLSFLSSFSINFQTLLGYQNPVSSIAVGHFWSLGIEEQFYLLYAPLLYVLRKHIWIVLLGFISIGFYFYNFQENFFVGFPNYSYYFTGHRFFIFWRWRSICIFP